MNKITIPNLKFPQFQDYILHINSAFAECVSKDVNHIVDLILENKVSIIEIKRERNFYGFTDYRIICR